MPLLFPGSLFPPKGNRRSKDLGQYNGISDHSSGFWQIGKAFFLNSSMDFNIFTRFLIRAYCKEISPLPRQGDFRLHGLFKTIKISYPNVPGVQLLVCPWDLVNAGAKGASPLSKYGKYP